MKSVFAILIAVLSIVISHSTLAEDETITCANSDGSIEVMLKFKGATPDKLVWQISRSLPPEEYLIAYSIKASELWPLSPVTTTEFPLGTYSGRSSSNNDMTLNIVRNASVGGGGFQWEGVLTHTYVGGQFLSWGVFCN